MPGRPPEKRNRSNLRNKPDAKRVANNDRISLLRERVQAFTGVDLQDFGNLSVSLVEDAKNLANASSEQLELLGVFLKYVNQIADNDVKTEAAAMQWLKDNEGRLRNMDKIVQSGMLLSEKHNGHMQLLAAKTTNSLGQMKHQTGLQLSEMDAQYVELISNNTAIAASRRRGNSRLNRYNKKRTLQGDRLAFKQRQSQAQRKSNVFDFLNGRPGAKKQLSRQDRAYGQLPASRSKLWA